MFDVRGLMFDVNQTSEIGESEVRVENRFCAGAARAE